MQHLWSQLFIGFSFPKVSSRLDRQICSFFIRAHFSCLSRKARFLSKFFPPALLQTFAHFSLFPQIHLQQFFFWDDGTTKSNSSVANVSLIQFNLYFCGFIWFTFGNPDMKNEWFRRCRKMEMKIKIKKIFFRERCKNPLLQMKNFTSFSINI